MKRNTQKAHKIHKAQIVFCAVLCLFAALKNFTGARMNLVYLYLLKRAPEKSILQLKEVLALEPENAEATEKMAELLFSQGRFDECISFIEKQRATRPGSSPNF